MSSRSQKIARKPRLTRKRVIERLIQTGGNITATADYFGVHRRRIYEMIHADEEVEEAMREGRERKIDRAEAIVWEALDRGDVEVAFRVLRTLGRDRGWSERVEQIVQGDVRIQLRWGDEDGLAD